MPLDKTRVCNLALGNVGSFQISDFVENSKESENCQQFFDTALENLLSKKD